MTGQTLRRFGIAALFGAAVALPFPAIAQDRGQDKQGAQDKSKPGTNEQSTDRKDAKAEKTKWTLKAFELKHRSPQELTQILTMRVGDGMLAPIAPPVPPVATYPTSAAYPVRQTAPGGLATTAAQPPTGAERISGYRGAEGQVYMAFDPEARLLFVRGPEDQVRKVEELVKALDVPNDKLQKTDFGNLHLIPVRQDKLPQVARTLSMLRINNQTLTIGDAAMIVIRAEDHDDGVAAEAREVIAKYNAAPAGNQETKPAKGGATDRNGK